MVISNTKVEMTVTPALLYKVIRVLNHFIEHIIKDHGNEGEDVTTESIWYLRWKTQYPIIKSSQRTMAETHCLIHDDYVTKEKDINMYELFMQMLHIVPHLNTCYDILPLGSNKQVLDVNKFKLVIVLYQGKLKNMKSVRRIGIKQIRTLV